MRRYYAAPRFLLDLFRLRRNVWLKLPKLVELQEKKLRAIVKYAYEKVPFYHRLLEANSIRPSDIRTIQDLQKIPIVTREDVQRNFAGMLSRDTNRDKCSKHKTSGSTGIPIPVFLDNNARNFHSVVSLRQFLECGGRFRDKQVQLRGTGSSFAPKSNSKPFYEYMGLLRTEWFTLTDIPDDLVSFLKAYNPQVMVGYPSLFELLSGKNDGVISPRVIFCTGEVLSSHCRSLMESSFGAEIIDCYGCTEGGDISWECPQEHSGYHINIDSIVVEFVKDGEIVEAGEEGEIVLTNLFNYSMPFIRYNVGDVGVPSDEQCSCGRTLPLMDLLSGRSDDFIVLPDGRRLSPLCILNSENFFEVSRFRLVQRRRNLIEVWLKMDEGYKEASVTRCISALRKVFGRDVDVRANIVDEIPRDNSGKIRRIVSEVCN